MKTTDFILVTTTTNDPETASQMAHSLLESRLVACVQSETIRSQYIWDSKLVSDDEIRLTLKCRSRLKANIMEHIEEMHNYDTPEIIVTPILDANIAYLEWLEAVET